MHNPLALNTYRTLHIKTHNAWQENKFSNVTVLTSEICHSRTLQDVDFLLLIGGIFASFLLQISLSVTAVIPRPDCSSDRSAKPLSVHRLKLSIAGSFSLSETTVLLNFPMTILQHRREHRFG